MTHQILFPYQRILHMEEQEKNKVKLIINSFSPPSSPLFSLPQLPLPLASSPSPFSSLPCHASILTESVSLWLSHPPLPLKLPLALYLSFCSIYMGLPPFFVLPFCVLWCLIARYYFYLFLPPPQSQHPYLTDLPVYLLPATAIIYLLTQLHIFLPSLMSSIWFCNSHATNSFCSSSKLLHPTLNVAFWSTQIWCAQHMSACKAALYT